MCVFEPAFPKQATFSWVSLILALLSAESKSFLSSFPEPIISCCKPRLISIIFWKRILVQSAYLPEFAVTLSIICCSLSLLKIGILFSALYLATSSEQFILRSSNSTSWLSISSISALISFKSIP